MYSAVHLDDSESHHLVGKLVYQVTCITMLNDPEYPSQLLDRSGFNEGEYTVLTQRLCEESLKDSCQGDQRKNILEFLAKIIEDYPKVAEMRSPECSFTEAVCFMCQHEACTGVGASQASRYEYQDTDTGNRKLDTFVEVGVYIIS